MKNSKLQTQNSKLILLLLLLTLFMLIGCQRDGSKPLKIVNGYPAIGNLKLEQVQLPREGEEIVVITTSMGVMKMRLFEDVAPKSVEYFKRLVSEGYYDGTYFDRIEKDYVNQIDYFKTFPNDQGGKQEYILEINPYYRHITGAIGTVYQNGGFQSTSINMVVNSGVEKEDLEAMEQVGEEYYPKDVIEAYKVFGGFPRVDNRFTVIGQIFYGLDILFEMNNAEVQLIETIGRYSVPVELILVEKMEIVTYYDEGEK